MRNVKNSGKWQHRSSCEAKPVQLFLSFESEKTRGHTNAMEYENLTAFLLTITPSVGFIVIGIIISPNIPNWFEVRKP